MSVFSPLCSVVPCCLVSSFTMWCTNSWCTSANEELGTLLSRTLSPTLWSLSSLSLYDCPVSLSYVLTTRFMVDLGCTMNRRWPTSIPQSSPCLRCHWLECTTRAVNAMCVAFHPNWVARSACGTIATMFSQATRRDSQDLCCFSLRQEERRRAEVHSYSTCHFDFSRS